MVAVESTRARWLNLLRWGVYGLILIPVWITIISRALIPPLIVFMVLFVVGLVLLQRNEKRGTIMLGVLALLFFLLNVPFIVDGLAHPEGWPEFIPMLVGVLGTITVLAAVTALLRNRGTDKAAGMLARTVVVLGIAGLALSVFSSLSVESDERQEGDTELVAEAIEWTDESLTVSGDSAIFVENKDLARHTFTVEELDIHEEIAPGQDVRVELAAEPGEYEFTCEVPGHESMEGTLTIE